MCHSVKVYLLKATGLVTSMAVRYCYQADVETEHRNENEFPIYELIN